MKDLTDFSRNGQQGSKANNSQTEGLYTFKEKNVMAKYILLWKEQIRPPDICRNFLSFVSLNKPSSVFLALNEIEVVPLIWEAQGGVVG
jgi:hypothetical protein